MTKTGFEFRSFGIGICLDFEFWNLELIIYFIPTFANR